MKGKKRKLDFDALGDAEGSQDFLSFLDSSMAYMEKIDAAEQQRGQKASYCWPREMMSGMSGMSGVRVCSVSVVRSPWPLNNNYSIPDTGY